MNFSISHRLRKIARNAPGLFWGYNIYVDTHKLRLIDHVYESCLPGAASFADLGGVWKVNAAYTLYSLRKHRIPAGTIVDTDFPAPLEEKLSRVPRLRVVRGDFTLPDVIQTVGPVDVAYFFDVLLHQANPSWDQVLTAYSRTTSCFVIYNQQYIQGPASLRLTDLPLEQYLAMTPPSGEEVARYAYAHVNELHPVYRKPWPDIHNIFQWAITDQDLRNVMTRLGFQEVYFRNHGRFSNLTAFENHAFVFLRF
jgi:hypothetical protein